MSSLDNTIRKLQLDCVDSRDYRIIESLSPKELLAFVHAMGDMNHIADNTLLKDFDNICSQYAKKLKTNYADKILIETIYDFYKDEK